MEKHAWKAGRHGRALKKALLAVLLTTPLAYLAHAILPHANLSLIYLIGVLLLASRYGTLTAIYTSLLSVLSFNFFFSQPYYTFYVADDGDIATLFFFLIVAGLSGKLATRMQEEIRENRFMVQRLTNINDFSRLLATAPDSDTILHDLAQHIATTFHAPTWVLLQKPDSSVHGHDGHQPLPVLPQHVRTELSLNSEDGKVTAGYQLHFRSPHGIEGAVYLQGTELDAAKHELVRILCDLATVTLERTRLVADLDRVQRAGETERLRSALLSSVSHDLRTPLSSIIGASSSIIEFGDTIPRADCKELHQTILTEAERLNRYIQNLLDMTRLGGGTLTPRRDWVDLGDIISTATERLQRELTGLEVELSMPEPSPLLYAQGVLIEQALVNVLDNAARFSPAGGTIHIKMTNDDKRITITVCDQGPGIPESERERVFDMFYTATRGDRHNQGTGLGLAICRGLLQAHGGDVSALAGLQGRGTCIELSLPHDSTEQQA